MKLARSAPTGAVISLTSLVDVMLILLVFFMVTSTYLDLRMLPIGPGAAEPGAAGPADAPATVETMLVRIDPAGWAVWQGRAYDPPELEAAIAARGAAAGAVRVLVLPSGLARAQALVAVLEAAARAGAAETRIVRVEDAG